MELDVFLGCTRLAATAVAAAKNHIRCFDNRKAAAAAAAVSCVRRVPYCASALLRWQIIVPAVDLCARSGWPPFLLQPKCTRRPRGVLCVVRVCVLSGQHTHTRTHVMLCARECSAAHKGKRPLNAHIQFVGHSAALVNMLFNRTASACTHTHTLPLSLSGGYASALCLSG